MSSYDAIIVPGGGLQADGTLPPAVAARLERAVAVAAPPAPIIALSAGTLHKAPPLDQRGAPVFESMAAARYLRERGFPCDRILWETASWDTLGNAYFCRVIHTDPRQLRRLLIITSAYHAPRTEAIFRAVFALPPLPVVYELAFESTPDAGMDPDSLAARVQKERDALADLRAKTQRWRSLAEFHNWMFSEHRFYAPCLWDTAEPLSPDLLRTY